MGIFTIRLPDVGEGVAEAELVEWHVSVGDTVLEDEMVGAVMTDKAAVDIPASASGKVIWLGGEIGDIIAVGADLIRLEVDGEGNTDAAAMQAADAKQASAAPLSAAPENAKNIEEFSNENSASTESSEAVGPAVEVRPQPPSALQSSQGNSTTAGKPLAAPSVRHKAREMGIDLRSVSGSGPGGRIVHEDLETHTIGSVGGRVPNTGIEEIKVVGLRRMIANKMSQAKKHIPHITIVEEIDVTSLEQTREELNASYETERGKLTVLPFIMKAVVEAVRQQPVINAHYDDEAEVIKQYGGVHIGIATQTESGLMVPVVKHCEVRNLWDNAAELTRLAGACRDGSAARDELSGSTITISSLGPLGAIATTPIINHPEVAIVGVNKMTTRPHWDGQQFVPRKMMNISCAFDHRVVDGWDAAVMVQKIKTLLEKPAMLLVEA